MDANERNVLEELLNRIRLEQLGQPYSLLGPRPLRFPEYSKADKFEIGEGSSINDPQLELLHSWGMPRDISYAIVTIPGRWYGAEFADFTIELFGVTSEPLDAEEVTHLPRRQVGQIQYSNADPTSIPKRAGLRFQITVDHNTCAMIAWRWRVFMDQSSLCLENLWHGLTGWIPFVLGIKYDNPEKMVADAHRFASAFRLCNLIEADLSNIRGGHRISDIEEWTATAIEKMAQDSLRVGKIAPYSFVKFSKAFPLSTSRQNVYNLLTQQDRESLESRYLKRCSELMMKPAD